jgi:hypothetical protein
MEEQKAWFTDLPDLREIDLAHKNVKIFYFTY